MEIRFFVTVTETHYADSCEVPDGATRAEMREAALAKFDSEDVPSETRTRVTLLDVKPAKDSGALMGNATRAESVAAPFAEFVKWATGETLDSIHEDDLRDAARDFVSNLGHFMRLRAGMTPEVWGEQVAQAARMTEAETREDSDES